MNGEKYKSVSHRVFLIIIGKILKMMGRVTNVVYVDHT